MIKGMIVIMHVAAESSGRACSRQNRYYTLSAAFFRG